MRFIPTLVGNTGACKRQQAPRPVHPHACGEHITGVIGLSTGTGSSPRLWGTLFTTVSTLTGGRFIPTLVGNTPPSFLSALCPTVHPHACGEHFPRGPCRNVDAGSSPRLWGTHKQRHRICEFYRFIPTLVGNTLPFAFEDLPISVHPHACGEHTSCTSLILL